MTEHPAGLRIVLGVILLVSGGLGVVYPYRLARIEEMMHAIGSTTPIDAVEPAAWKVSLTKFTSGIVAFVGLWWILLGVGAV